MGGNWEWDGNGVGNWKLSSTKQLQLNMFVPTRFLPNARDPFKRPDRRLCRCRYLLEHGREPSASQDDEITAEAWAYLRELGRCGQGDIERLDRRFPIVAEAFRFFISAEPLRLAELDARLLANQSDGKIAERMGLSPTGVACYAGLCFDVRPYLRCDGYVVNVVLGPKIHRGLTPGDHELLLKLFGYGLGGCGVDAYLDFLRDPPVVPASLADLDVPALRRLRDRLQVKVAVLALTTPAADLPPATWLRLLQQFAATRRGRAPDGGKDAVVCTIRAALDAVACLSAVPRPTGGDTAEQAAGSDSPLSVARIGAGDAGRSDRQREPVPA
jgi:hypothetical protein